jgi:hypothetical protein
MSKRPTSAKTKKPATKEPEEEPATRGKDKLRTKKEKTKEQPRKKIETTKEQKKKPQKREFDESMKRPNESKNPKMEKEEVDPELEKLQKSIMDRINKSQKYIFGALIDVKKMRLDQCDRTFAKRVQAATTNIIRSTKDFLVEEKRMKQHDLGI